jgi:hypothetical protein
MAIILPTKKLSHIKKFLRKGREGYHHRLKRLRRCNREISRYSRRVINLFLSKKIKETIKGSVG